MKKPNGDDYREKPYAYIYELLKYVEYLEEQLKIKDNNTNSYPKSEIEYISQHWVS